MPHPSPSLDFIHRIVLDAGGAAMEHFGHVRTIGTKAHEADFVTEADLAANASLIRNIQSAFPGHSIISEELPLPDPIGEDVWIIDPNDGTRNFRAGAPLFGVMVAYVHDGRVTAAAVRFPALDETYMAVRGRGAYRTTRETGVEERISCSTATSIYRTFPLIDGFLSLAAHDALTRAQHEHSLWVTNHGAGAFGVYAADGRRDWALLGRAGGMWDLAAPSLILEESGCMVTGLDGGPFKVFANEGYLAAPPAIHADLLALLPENPIAR